MEHLSTLSNLELADLITTWSGRVAAGEARLLALIGEFDEREAWGGPGLLSCAHWLTWKTGLSAGAAREKVRVARALRVLPLVAEALGQGRMSFSQARAVTRVAAPDDQVRWVELARHTTAAQLERLARGVSRVRRTLEDEADPERAVWRMRTTVSYDDDGGARITMLLPAQQSAVVMAALEQVQAELDRQAAGDRDEQEQWESADVSAETPTAAAGPSTPGPVPRASLARALVEMARQQLDRVTSDRARRGRARLIAQVDPISGWGRLVDGELLPPSALSEVAPVLRGTPGRVGAEHGLRPLRPEDLARADLGRSARLPSQGLRDLLGAVDGERCRFPGCTRRRRLHAHHVRFWRDGGGTDMDNLVLVCARHHTLVHQQGFGLVLGPDRRLSVTTADGVPVLHHPALPWGEAEALDPDADVSAETLVPDSVSRMDLDYCVAVLLQQAA